MEDPVNVAARPLLGRRIAVTRPPEQAASLAEGLRALGAEPLAFPTIRIADPADPAPLRSAVAALESYDWIVFTSANGVARFWRQLRAAGLKEELPNDIRVAAIGPATAEALVARGAHPQVVPEEYVAEAVAEALTQVDVAGLRVLLPRAAGARQVLPERLRAAGAEVDEVVAYESQPDEESVAALKAEIGRRAIDLVTFTAASTVRSYVELAGNDLGETRVAVIGPITAEAARSLGVQVDTVTQEYTVRRLLEAICDYFAAME